MKKLSKRLLTMLLAAAMVFGLSGMTAFAAEADGQDAQGLSAQDEIMPLLGAGDYVPPVIDTEPDVTYRQYEPDESDFAWYKDLGPDAASYEINTREELAAFSDIVNGTDLPAGISQDSFRGQTVTLGQNIEMNDPDDVWSEDGTEGGTAVPTLHVSENAYAFTPIGNMKFNPNGSAASGYSFEGTFDGNGHTIENLFVFSGLEEDGYDGLFGTVGSENYAKEAEASDPIGVLKNFAITGLIWVRGGYYDAEIDFVGAACARLTAGGIIEDVTNEARIYAPYSDNVGGIVGFAGTPHAMGGSSETGGGTDTYDPGYEENPSGYNTFVERCANKGPVSAFHKNGGIVGENAATVKYCYNSGWIQCRRNYSGIRMGGIAGTNGNNGGPCEESVIAYCYNAGTISNNGCDDLSYSAPGNNPGVRGYGGITGSNYGGHGKNEIYNCYNIGAIPEGYGNYNSIASYLDDDASYGSGAYVSIRNNYTLNPADDIVINSASTQPQETGIFKSWDEFTSSEYGYYYDEENKEEVVTCLTGLGPYFVYDEYGDNPKYEHFPILWWQKAGATLPTLTGITITHEPDKTTGYIPGDTFDATGMVVIAEYDNGASALLTPDIDSHNGTWYKRSDGYHYQYEANSGESLDGSKTYVEITYTDGENTVSAWQPVNGAEPTVGTVNITSNMTDNSKTYDGEEVTLTAETPDVEPAGAEMTYQWYHGNDAIAGATEKEYTLDGNVSDSGTYQCVVTASYGGAESAPATGEITITIEKAAQEISFEESTVAKMLGDESFTKKVVETTVDTAGGATVSYESGNEAIATVDPASGEVTIVGTGSTTITATASATANYEAASASYELTVDPPEPPSISGVTITSNMEGNTKTYDGAEVTLTADAEFEPASAVLTYQWYKDGGEMAGETGETLTLPGGVSDTGTYRCVVTATTVVDSVDAESDPITITITQAEQVIEFTDDSVSKPVGETYKNELTSDSVVFGTITYESDDESVATVDADGTVTIVGVGSATITAAAAGSDNYTEAKRSYTITGTDEGLSVEVRSDVDGNEKVYDAEPVILTADASSSVDGATFSYQWYKDGDVIDGATGETLTLAGDVSDSGSYTCEVTVTYPNDVTDTVTSDAVTITITKAAQEISFAESAVTKVMGDEPFTKELTETTVDTAGGATITYESGDEAIATVDPTSGEVTIVGIGTTTITATASATANYAEASASYDLTIEAAQVPAVDKTTLEEEIDTAESLTADDYTEASWQALEDALATAEAVAADPEAQQSEVDAAAEALKTAMDNLVAVPADKAVLKAAIDDADALHAEDYTEESWSALQEALTVANAVYADNNATADDVKEAEFALIEAIAHLKGVGGQTANSADKEALLDEYEKGMNLTKSDYTAASWAALETALADAQNVLLDVNATQADVEAAAEALKAAMDNLEKKSGTSGTGGNVKNGLCKITAGEEWGYFVNDVVDKSYTGFAHNNYGDWYVVNGYVHFDQNTVAKDKTGKNGDKGVGAAGTWYYVVGSKVQHDFTGLAHYKNQNGWWYITKGEVDFTHNGVDKNQNGWWYVKSGKVEFGHNGVDKNQYGWWYITGGKVQFDFTGLANYKNANGWWYIKEGKVDFTHNGVDKNRYGWWYVNNGKVDFGYNGRASNRYGTWNIVNGKVVF